MAINTKKNPYEGFTVQKLKKIIKEAARTHANVLPGWETPPKNLDYDEHVEHLREMCQEFALVPDENGNLIKIDR